MNPDPKSPPSGSAFWRLLLAAFLVMLVAAGAAGLEAFRFLNTAPNPLATEKVRFEIPFGTPAPGVARQLKELGLITEERHFYWYIRARQAAIKAGEYEMAPSLKPPEVLKLLESGMVVWHEFRFPEGITGWEVARRLAADGFGAEAEFVALIYSPEFAAELGIPSDRIEGYLFPAVHRFSKPFRPAGILRQMVQALRNNVPASLIEEGRARGLKDFHEILTLASIIEKETGLASERTVISSVFHNRLVKRMRLQTDPTVIYGLLPFFDGNIRRDDLTRDHPYNTYTRAGLPPGPIAQPGLASIEAAVRPADTEYLFFVSRNDGSHVFTRTYAEHNEAVAYWQMNAARRRMMREKAKERAAPGP